MRRPAYKAIGDLANMEVAWAIGFPDAVSMREQAAVVGNTLFAPVGESNNRVFAFDISDSVADQATCAPVGVGRQAHRLHTSAAYGKRKDGLPIVVVGDIGGYTSAINARTGEFLWEAHSGFYEASTRYRHACRHRRQGICALLAVRDHDGGLGCACLLQDPWRRQRGRFHDRQDRLAGPCTMEDAEAAEGDRGDGQMLWGPAGAPIWNSPSVDVKRNRLYVGTGEANSFEAHKIPRPTR